MMATKTQELASFVYRTIGQLQENYLQGSPQAKADLAALRKNANKTIGETPETWAMLSHGYPESLIGKGMNPSPAENAIFLALTMFASHMQSKRQPMHVKGEGFGTAMRKLAAASDADLFESSMFKRFVSVHQAQTMEATTYHLRSLIKLFRSKDIPLDYGQLAVDLYRLQFPDSRTGVQLSWARQLYRTQNSETPKGTSNV